MDKTRDSVVRESEDNIMEFEAKYQALAQELQSLQDSYKSARILLLEARNACLICI